ncbi:thioredoxin family protein [Stratiformator vulcanicus]|uniref:Thioredoxin C-1 n=1 Tax=Stratiformator vulcanicus TaxID=2527980 RepID=A0A517QVT0_9PLAN|nr:thioredoxin family protein [Stratiformator vulcanicus]QDT35677.1 Thioredoxin C-1 [Stratiformator vulcanicus]
MLLQKSLSFCALTVMVLVASLTISSASAGSWHRDFDAAQSEARKLGVPLVVHFYADWCGPCRAMESVLNSSTITSELGTSAVGVKVNVDHHGDLKRRFGVAALPTDVILSPSGDVVSRYVGGTSTNGYLARLDSGAARIEKRSDRRVEIVKRDATEVLSDLAEEQGLGLDGYSPVALVQEKVWSQGDPKFAWRHQGVVYYLADAEELAQFRDQPEKFAPRYSGFDPTILATKRQPIPGRIEYGSFYKDRLYLHATEDSRRRFIDNPRRFPLPRELKDPQFADNGRGERMNGI